MYYTIKIVYENHNPVKHFQNDVVMALFGVVST